MSDRVKSQTSEDCFDSGHQFFLCIFARLFASACVFHFLSEKYLVGTLAIVVVSLGLIVMWRPSLRLLFLLCLVQSTHTCLVLREGSNHWLLAGGISATVLVWLVRHWGKKEGIVPLLVAIRVLGIICYFFAFFHKLNRDFLDGSLSCANFLVAQLSPLIVNAPFFATANPFFVLAIEALVLSTLAARRFRSIGYFFGFLFHGILGFSPGRFYDFSSLVFVLFAVSAFIQSGQGRVKESALLVSSRLSVPACGLITLSAALQLLFPEHSFGLRSWLVPAAWLVFIVYAATTVALISRFGEVRNSVSLPLVYLGIPFFFLINNLGPYLGVKIEQVFSIYSNLRVSGCMTNHLIISRSLCLADFLNPVRVLSVSEPRMLFSLPRNVDIAKFELYSVLSQFPDGMVTYQEDGVTKTLSNRDLVNLRATQVMRHFIAIPPGYTNRFEQCGRANWASTANDY